MTDDRFSELMARARGGESAAVEELLSNYEDDLRMIVRVHLPRALRTKYDSMDFVQAVWTSFFTGADRPAATFDNERHFRSYLAAMARNKVLAEYRRRTKTGKYDLRREAPLYVKKGAREEPRSVVAPDPSPSQQVQAEDRLNQMVRGGSPLESHIIAMRRQGLTFQEIASRLEVHERSVRRIVDNLRDRLDAERGS